MKESILAFAEFRENSCGAEEVEDSNEGMWVDCSNLIVRILIVRISGQGRMTESTNDLIGNARE